MKEYFRLAWRNIWRNKRRTGITMASIFFAMFFALVMRSMQLGTYGHAITGVVENFTGYIQVHKCGYWDEQIIDNVMFIPDSTTLNISALTDVSAVLPRLSSYALAATNEVTKPVMVMGMDPKAETQMSKPEEKIVRGKMFSAGTNGALIGVDLAEYLKVDIGDTITLIGQGYHGNSAAGLFPVTGIVSFPNPEMNRRIVMIDLQSAQDFYSAGSGVSSILINLHNSESMESVVLALKEMLDPNEYEVMTWREISPELVQQIESDQAGGFIVLLILYLVVGFGVFGTLIMMTAERKREFGVMVAVGMQKWRLAIVLTIEMLFMGLIGILSGIAGSIPVIYIMHRNPLRFGGEIGDMMADFGYEAIMPFAWQSDFFFGQALIVVVIFIIAILYPVYSTTKLKVIKALKA